MKKLLFVFLSVCALIFIGEIGFYIYSRYNPKKNTNTSKSRSLSSSYINEQAIPPDSLKSAFTFFNDKKDRVVVKGEVITVPWVTGSQAFMEVRVSSVDKSKTLPLKIFIGDASWLYGYSVSDNQWESGSLAKLQSYIKKGGRVELEVRLVMTQDEIDRILKSDKCDSVCKSQLDISKAWALKNHQAIEQIFKNSDSNNTLSENYVLGPIYQVKIIQ